ncbi:pyridine nucleotide-disulfide oxidoreductase-domain-containing protein [Zychaea mexicana]|uniref:pyridine nucleotide-disulfide oxidoreductase-domain-containing protein n=1 Tax=Zychaea mexicana TaxID=64656 RepID=UPI0022FE137E|nr:pyridine nucleotide-disulfide oxidoreductase-domain-containing protein [Zychaea mexicana]KAI9493268.1 pyridine nucleotide-disulfide oxidoreductase-domain-containing protein [Zychaea mexicana]
MFRVLSRTASAPRQSFSARTYYRALATSTKQGGSSSSSSRRRRILGWTAGGAALVGASTYLMAQDYMFLEEAKGAREQVPFLALHPQRGGAKDLQIVTHQLDEHEQDQEKPRLVIIGSGWGAVSVLRNLDKDKFNVTVISPNNYFLFTPLLPSATVGTNEPRSLLEPIRKIAARVRGHFLEARAVDVDIENKLVEVKSTGVNGADGEREHFYVPYDQLVLAVGATSITHGIQGLDHTFQLKTVQDAMAIRRKVMENVEKACLPTTTPDERKKLLSFVVCGGGPTGVEFAAELFDWINEDLVKWFPKLLREDVSVTIIQSRDHILNMFDVRISEYAEKRFRRENINVITNARVQRIEDDKVVYKFKGKADEGTHDIPYGLCLWSTGIAMTPFVQALSDKLGQQNHRRVLLTDEYLRVKGVPDMSIYAVGDCATIDNPKLVEHIREIFESADSDKDGRLNAAEFNNAVTYMKKKFPLTRQHFNKLERAFENYDLDHSGTIEIEELGKFAREIDSKMTQLPATAQVASQQGQFIAKFVGGNSEQPFMYRHLGTLAYLGNTAVGEFSWGYKMIGGLYSMYLWRSVYWSEQVSTRTRMNLSLDWSKRALFGRDISIV